MNDSAPNFERDLLDEVVHEVVVPKPLPKGLYLCVVPMPTQGVSRDKGTKCTEFMLKPIQAHEDISDEELSEALGDDSLQDREIRVQFWESPRAIYRLDQFHQACGIDLQNDDSTRRQRNEAVVNREVWAELVYEPSRTDPNRSFPKVNRFLPAD